MPKDHDTVTRKLWDTHKAFVALDELRILRRIMDVICHRMDDLQDSCLSEMDTCLQEFKGMPTAAANECDREVKKIATYAIKHLRDAADDIVAAIHLTPEDYQSIRKELASD